MNGKNVLIAAGLALAVAGVSRANTIVVTSDSALSNPSAGVYAYDISLDASANVQSDDGFAIFDFAGYVAGSAALSAETGSLSGLTTSRLAVSSDGTGVSPLNNAAGVVNLAITAAANASPAFTLVNGSNIVVDNTGAAITGTGTAVLTIDSTDKGTSAFSFSSSVDHSGVAGTFGTAQKEIEVAAVAAVPLPNSMLGVGVLMSMLGIYKFRKSAVLA